MRYIIIDRNTGEIVGKEGGYRTRGSALNARFNFPHVAGAYEYVREVLKCSPGEDFRNNICQYVEDHFEVVEINKIFLQGSDGRIYTKEV